MDQILKDLQELQGENAALKLLINEIIDTLAGRDDSVKQWIQEQLEEITN